MVEVDHLNGYTTRYSNNSKNLVIVGQLISKGQLIAKMGGAGRPVGSYIDFMVFKNGKAVNTLPYINVFKKKAGTY